MVQLLRQNCQFYGFKDEDANEHLGKYLSITQFIKQNGVSQDIINLNLFPFTLTHEAESWFYTLKTHSTHTWEEMVSKFLSKYYLYSRALQLRKEILNFRQLPTKSIFEAWERFKSYQERLMVAAGGNFMRKTPQEAYDLIENMTHHHFQWDAEVYYDTTTDMSAHYSKTTFASSEQVEETDTLLPHHDSTSPEVDDDKFDPEGDILFLEGLLNDEILSDLPPLELNNDPEGDILFLENLLKDEHLEANKSEINPLIREPPNTFLIGDEEIKLNSHEDIDDLVPIPRVSEKPLESLDCISKTFDMTITDPLFDFDSEFTLDSNNPIFGIHNEESDESKTKTIIDEVQNHSLQSTAQIPPPYEKLNFDLTMPKPILTFSHFRYGFFGSHRVFDILGLRLLFSLSYNFGLIFSKEYLKFLSLNIFLLGDKNEVFDPGIIVIYVESEV
ncbi:reverse transcriptase domain-containing protein [Tanacetum coccineum]